MKAFDLEARNGTVVHGIALVFNIGLKTECIRVGRAQQARWIKRNPLYPAVFDETTTSVLECGIEEFHADGTTYHSIVDPDPADDRALLRITTMPQRTTANRDKGYTLPLFGEPFLGLTGYGVTGTKTAPGQTWEESLYVLRPVSLPDRQLEAVLVHPQGTDPGNDIVALYEGGTVLLLDLDEFIEHYVQTWILSATPEEFHHAFTLANERNHRRLAAFMREMYATYTSL